MDFLCIDLKFARFDPSIHRQLQLSERNILFFAGRHGDMVLQDCPLLMLAQGQTWSFTPVSVRRGERPPIRHRSRRATFPQEGGGA